MKPKLTELTGKYIEEKKDIGLSIVMPAVSPDEAVKAWKAYQDLKKQIAMPEDVQIMNGREFYKKSYWRKIATFFNLSVEITEEKEDKSNPANTVYHFTQKAIAPNGRYAFGTGSCDQLEKGRKNTTHNTRSTAETRAFNRAVSNLVGGGEVSAEEIDSEEIKTQNPMDVKSRENGIVNASPIEKITDKQIYYLKRLLKEKGYTEKQMLAKYGLISALKKTQAIEIIDSLLKLPDAEVDEVQVSPTEPEIDINEVDEGINQMRNTK